MRQARRAIKIVFGFTLLVAGAVMILTPGPGWATIFAGLAVLAAEYLWARRLLDRLKGHATRLREYVVPGATRNENTTAENSRETLTPTAP